MRHLGYLIAATLAVQGCASQQTSTQPVQSTSLAPPEAWIEEGYEWDEFSVGEVAEPGDQLFFPNQRYLNLPRSTYPVRVQLSDTLDADQRILGRTALEEVPGVVVVDDGASFELTAHPEFPEHLVFYGIKGASADDLGGMDTSFRIEGTMTLEEMLDFYENENSLLYSWASNVPMPVQLGRADRPEFANDLRNTLIPITQKAGLAALSRFTDPEWLTLCVSAERPMANMCPQLPGSNENQISNTDPVYLSVTNHNGDYKFITIVGVSPTGVHNVMFQDWTRPEYRVIPSVAEVEARTHAGTEEQQQGTKIYRIEGEPATNSSQPPVIGEVDPNAPAEPYDPRPQRTFASSSMPYPFFAEPGQHRVYVIATDAPIDPAIFDLQFGDPVPADICNNATLGLCLARTGADPEELTMRVIDIAGYTVNSLGEINKIRRVVRGETANRAEAMWQAQLFVYRPGDPYYRSTASPRYNFEKMHKCGGSYIGGGHILTAAHCIRDDIGEMRIRLGTNDMVRGGRTFKVHSVVIHRRGDASSERADIAVIKVDDPREQIQELWENGDLAAIAMAPHGTPQTGLGDLLATGWGYTSVMASGADGPRAIDGSFQRNPRYLQGIKLQALTPSRCTDRTAFQRYAAGDIICARSIVEGGDTCAGDSGGPLSVQRGQRRLLVGIVSAGIGCAQGRIPSVYVNVAEFEGWIKRARRALASTPRGRVMLMN